MILIAENKEKFGKMNLYACEQQNNRGSILFIHGFNSSHKIWGKEDENGSFVYDFYNRGYSCYLLKFSSTFFSSIVSLAENELKLAIETIFSRSANSHELILIAHSLGGIILRQFFQMEKKNSAIKLKNDVFNRISGIALLATPNHGVSISESSYKRSGKKKEELREDSGKSQNSLSNRIKRSIFEVLEIDSLIENKMMGNTILELYPGSKIIRSLNRDLSKNLWSNIRIFNIIASRDIVVNHESAAFYPEEVEYHKKFQQLEFESTHMKNPFKWRELSKLFKKKELKRVKTEIEQKLPFVGYFSLKPIYANTDVIKILVDYFT